MSSQYFIVPNSAYYYMGLMNIINLLGKRKVFIQNALGKYFPDLETNWSTVWNDDISPILMSFGSDKLINNAMPDKPDSQGDGSKTPWAMSRGQGDVDIMYNLLSNAGITMSEDYSIDATLDLLQSNPSDYHSKFTRVLNIISFIEKIHELETTIYVITFSISPLYKVETPEKTINRSPGQLLTIAGDMINQPYLLDENGLGFIEVPWGTIDNVMNLYFSQTFLDNKIFRVDISSEIVYVDDNFTGVISYQGDPSATETINIAKSGYMIFAITSTTINGIDTGGESLEIYLSDLELNFDDSEVYISHEEFSDFLNPSDINYTIKVKYIQNC